MRQITTATGFIIATLIGAGTTFGQTWGRPSAPSVGACFYEGRDFSGQYFCARIGGSSEAVGRWGRTIGSRRFASSGRQK